MIKIKTLLVISTLLITACSHNTGRYQHKNDSTPSRLPSQSELHDATPRQEPHSRGGNKNYTVRGKHYSVLKSANNFKETGIASWYGQKFHGHLTSNGEIYDMYAMSAAHKNLPLPSYVKVVNNDNGRSVIVRVNDRGPFHQSRIIDLSYSAAYKLDMLKTGTANVTVTAITDFGQSPKSTKSAVNSSKNKTHSTIVKTSDTGNIIQIFATKNKLQANKVISNLQREQKINAKIQNVNGIFRVIVSPINNLKPMQTLLLALKNNGFPSAFIRKSD